MRDGRTFTSANPACTPCRAHPRAQRAWRRALPTRERIDVELSRLAEAELGLYSPSLNGLSAYLRVVASHSVAWGTGSALVLIIAAWEHWKKKSLSWAWFAAFLSCGFFWSTFLAW